MSQAVGTNGGRWAIRSERVLLERSFAPATVVVEEGRIIEVLTGAAGAAEPLPGTDLGRVALLPGLVDTHVHVNEPGRTEWEGFETATLAAAAGGVTTLVDMPLNCIPVTTNLDALEAKLSAVAGLLRVDAGFWGGVVPGNAADLARMAERGMLGAKCFLCDSGIDDFPRSSLDDLRLAMPVLRDAGLPLLVHAELELDGTPACTGDVRAYRTYLASRPRSWEDAAITAMIALCRETRCAVHIVHLSSASALPMIRAAKDEGLPFSVETCPHYLCLAAEEIADGATAFKCSPPIREAMNREALWTGLDDGVIDLLTSDHSPCTPQLKIPLEGDFCGAWGGIASLCLGLSSVWARASTRGMSLEATVELMTARPAQLAGLGRRKGRIARGMDADFFAFDPEARWTVDESALPFRHKLSPYVGREVLGRALSTWVRGQQVYGEGAQASGAGHTLLARDG